MKPRSSLKITFEREVMHLRPKCVAALRNWSISAVSRAYGVSEFQLRKWRDQEGIKPYDGPKKPMPEEGQELT